MFKRKSITIFIIYCHVIFSIFPIQFSYDNNKDEFCFTPNSDCSIVDNLSDYLSSKNKYINQYNDSLGVSFDIPSFDIPTDEPKKEDDEVKMGMFNKDNWRFWDFNLPVNEKSSNNNLSNNGTDSLEEQKRKEAEAYEQYVLSKESQLTNKIKELERLKEQIKIREDNIEKSNDLMTKSVNYKLLKDLESQLVQKQKIIEKESEDVQWSWNYLGDLYAKLDCSGDPVEVHSGKFIANYTDYRAQDFNNAFKVERRLSNDNSKGSFGNNWISSLDSRIIRCNYDDKNELIDCLEEKISILQKIMSEYESFYNSFNRESYENKRSYNDALSEEKEIINQLEYYRRCEKYRKILLEKNKYVTYGKYSSWENYYGFEDLIIYVDEQGNEFLFKYKTEGKWELVNEELKNKIIIKGFDESGKYCNDLYCNGGYEVIFENGSKKYFSKYGILIKEIDNNNNVTEYFSNNGIINEIKLKTGELITIGRNKDNYISSISGAVSGVTNYEYEGDFLKNVNFYDGRNNIYSYLDSGELCEIIKDNNSKVKIEYKYNNDLKRNVCFKVINENGFEELFDLDVQNNVMKHNYYGEGEEVYNFDKRGRTVYYSDLYNNICKIKRDDNGKINNININGSIETYFYNNENQLIQISYDNKSDKKYIYNEFGKIKNIKNRDNENKSFEYDQNGNLISESCNGVKLKQFYYYPNGLVKEIISNNIRKTYKYNNFGSVTEESIILPNGNNLVTKWKYNEKNNLIEKIDIDGNITNFEYFENKDITKTDKYIKTRTFNSRGWILTEVTKELSTGISYEKKYEYDNTGNITKVFLNNNLFTEYEYYKTDILKSCTVWNIPDDNYAIEGIKTDYIYNNSWQISKVIKSKITEGKTTDSIISEEYEYSKHNGKNIIKYKEYLKPYIISTYDNYGNLIRKEWENGFYEIYNYSPGGRLIEKRDKNNNSYKLIYEKDGSYKIIYKNGNGGIISYSYNSNNLITKMKDYYGFIYNFEYDSFNRLIKETGPDYYIKRDYDNSGRLVNYSLYSKNGEIKNNYTVEYNNDSNEEKIFINDKLNSIKKYDIWGRTIESNDIGGHYFYEYDCIGNCIKITDYYGNCSDLQYSPLGDVVIKKLPDGTVEQYDYSLTGSLKSASCNGFSFLDIKNDSKGLEIINKGTVKNIKYSNDNSQVLLNDYDTGLLKRKRINDNNFQLIDDYNNCYNYKYDDNGNLIEEINPLGEKLIYEYDEKGLRKFKDYSGIIQEYFYDKEHRKIKIKYNNNSKIEITKNLLDQTVELFNDDYKLFYKYDNGGNLVSIYSQLTDTLIEYKYDDFGRCIEKEGNNFIFCFEYDEMSRLSKVYDKKNGNFVSFKYDKLGRVIREELSNGNITEYSYNHIGQIEYCITKNNFGLIIYSNYILYDNYGRISLISDKEGNITKYKYDKTGRLISTEYPFTEKLKTFYVNEARDCGLLLPGNDIKPEKLSLEENELYDIRKLYEKSGVFSFLDVNRNQLSWIENYSYDKNGNILKVENPVGEINYKYDKLNRVISKNYNNTESFGIKISWNKDNCIERIENKEYLILFKYGNNKRPVEILSKNLITGEIKKSEYSYDGIGRRVLEKNNSCTLEYIYDGFTTNLLSKQIITNGKYVSTVVSDYNDRNLLYKTDDLSSYNARNDGKSIYNPEYKPHADKRTYNRDNSSSQMTEKHQLENRSYSILAFGNCPLLISYVDGLSKNNNSCEFILKDFKNDFVGTTNDKGEIENILKADTWGNINSNESKINVWGLRNTDNEFTFIINLGFRDYIPLIKSFTTEDPLRAGKNWFGYCCTDPINYKDKLGYEKKSLSKADQCYFRAQMMDYAAFNEYDYHKAMAKGELYLGLHKLYDCADTSVAINVYIAQQLGIELDSQVAKDFGLFHSEKKYRDAKTTISSSSMIDSPEIRKVCDGADYEYIKYSEEVMGQKNPKHGYDEANYNKAKKDREKFEAMITDPKNISPGTVIAIKDSSVRRDNTPERCGHTMTVVSVEYNEDNSKVIGFSFLQGHTGGNKTELKYINLEPNNNDIAISDFMGANAGLYELESIVSVSNNEDSTGESCVK